MLNDWAKSTAIATATQQMVEPLSGAMASIDVAMLKIDEAKDVAVTLIAEAQKQASKAAAQASTEINQVAAKFRAEYDELAVSLKEKGVVESLVSAINANDALAKMLREGLVQDQQTEIWSARHILTGDKETLATKLYVTPGYTVAEGVVWWAPYSGAGNVSALINVNLRSSADRKAVLLNVWADSAKLADRSVSISVFAVLVPDVQEGPRPGADPGREEAKK